MKKLIFLMVVLFTTSNFVIAQRVGVPAGAVLNTNSTNGAGLLGHVQSNNINDLGNFASQWIGIGQPVPGAYGTRIQSNNNAFITALTGTGANKNAELNFGGPGKTGRFEINKINDFFNPAAKSNYFSVLHDGRIGIGTRSPAYKLQVQGDIYANGGWFRVSGKRGLYFQSYGGGLYMTDHSWIRTYGNKNFYHNTGIMRTDGTFQVGPSGNRLVVTTGSHVGIQQTAPKGPLHIGQQLILSSPHTNGGWGGIGQGWYWNNGDKGVIGGPVAAMMFTPGGDAIFRTAHSNGNNGSLSNIKHIMRVHHGRGVSINGDYLHGDTQLAVNGTVRAYNYWSYSDKKFKQNIKRIDNALDKINALDGMTYKFKEEKIGDYDFSLLKGKEQLGFIAQNLKEVLPELVSEDDNGYQSVNYIGVIPVLVEAVKEQQDVIGEQETVITELNETVESLEARLEKLEALMNNSNSGSIDSNRPANVTTTDLSGIVLKQNAPNPFKGITTIDYEIPENLGTASLVVYDLNGKTITTYDVSNKGTVRFDASNLSNGTYVYAIIANGQSIATQKMIIQK